MRAYGRVVVTVGFLVLGLGAVEVAPAGAGGGGCHRDMQFGPVESGGTTVELLQACMTPSVLRIEPGTVVTFVNRDDFSHNLYGSGMSVHDLATEGRVAFRFDDAGTFAYACTLHPGMVGAIAVGDGRRTRPATSSILPVDVGPAASVPPTTAAPVPLSATSAAAGAADSDVPGAPAAIALTTVAVLAYVAGRRGRRRVSAPS